MRYPGATNRPSGSGVPFRIGLIRRPFGRNQGAAIVRPQDFMQVDLASEPFGESGEPPFQLFAGGRFAQLLTQQEFAVDQLEGRLVVVPYPWMHKRDRFRRAPLALPPSPHLVAAEPLEQLLATGLATAHQDRVEVAGTLGLGGPDAPGGKLAVGGRVAGLGVMAIG